MSQSLQNREDIFLFHLFCPKAIFLIFVFYLKVQCIEYTFRIYIPKALLYTLLYMLACCLFTSLFLKQHNKITECLTKCSFCIRLARNNQAFPSKEIDISFKTPEVALAHEIPLLTTSKAKYLRTNSFILVGFVNKGNTCYSSVILQVLSVLPSFWNRAPSESSSSSLLLKSITLNMKIKHQILYKPSLARSQSLTMQHLILTPSKILLRYYSH